MRKLRTTVFIALLGFASLSVPLVSNAAAPRNLSELVNMLVKILNGGATFLILLAFIILFWNMLKNILKKNGLLGKDTQFSRAIMWGIAGLFVMVSIWGIIRILQGTLFGNGGGVANPGGTAAPLRFTLPTVQ